MKTFKECISKDFIKNLELIEQIKNEQNCRYEKLKKEVLKKYSKKFYNSLKKELKTIYVDEGFGIKQIVKEIPFLSYSRLRCYLELLFEIPIRKGYNVITERLKISRKEKALYEVKHGIGWASNEVRKNSRSKTQTRGIAGYYWNKHFNKWVRLRSSWEYIYAKWLDEKKIIWDNEVTSYKLKDGRKYLPDFFIYNEKRKLKQIVEIKGYSLWDRGNTEMLQEEYPKLKIIKITNIRDFINENSSEGKERQLWKLNKKTKI